MNRIFAAAAAILFGSILPVSAHPAPFSYLDVHLGEGAAAVTLVVHVLDVAHDLQLDERGLLDPAIVAARAEDVLKLLRGRFQLTADGRPLTAVSWTAPRALPEKQALEVGARFVIERPPGIVKVAADMFPYDPQHQTFVNVYERGALTSQAVLARGKHDVEHFAGSRQGTMAVVRRFIPSGIHHILIGPDHLLFLVGLLLLGGSLRQLVLVVSAFTVAHSVTLSLAALNVVSPPAWIVEPAIALSIVYVGADNLTVKGGRDMRAWIAFGFGLIHGFGFANVLREMDLPARALGWSLLSFNIGVEIGQLAVVLGVGAALAAVRARSELAARRLAVAGSVVVIVAGAFWFFERVFV